jgi:AcrR family transcriptional regulator
VGEIGDEAGLTSGRARRRPVQERSAETVQKINEATSRLLARGVAPDAMTTAQIAAEAGVSVGALYRFFPDKQAIVDALAVRRVEEFQTALFGNLPLENLSAESLPAMLAWMDGPALLAFVIDAFVEFLESHPDLVTIAYGGPHISRGTRERQSGADAGVAVLVKRHMVQVLGVALTPELDLRLRIACEVGDRLLGMAMAQSDRQARDDIIAETKRLLAGYLFDSSDKT